MNIDKMKALADQQAIDEEEYGNLMRLYQAAQEEMAAVFEGKVQEAFSDFLTQNGFAVSRRDEYIIAEYKTLRVSLEHKRDIPFLRDAASCLMSAKGYFLLNLPDSNQYAVYLADRLSTAQGISGSVRRMIGVLKKALSRSPEPMTYLCQKSRAANLPTIQAALSGERGFSSPRDILLRIFSDD